MSSHNPFPPRPLPLDVTDGNADTDAPRAAGKAPDPQGDGDRPAKPPSLHTAFREDRSRSYKEFGATALLVVGTMLVVAGLVRPTAPGSPEGLALGVVLLGLGVAVLFWVVRAAAASADEGDTAEDA